MGNEVDCFVVYVSAPLSRNLDFLAHFMFVFEETFESENLLLAIEDYRELM